MREDGIGCGSPCKIIGNNLSSCNKSNCIFRKHSRLYVETCTTMIISMDYCRKYGWFVKRIDLSLGDFIYWKQYKTKL
jgi:hypothetical protein